LGVRLGGSAAGVAATSLVLGLAGIVSWLVWISLDWPLIWDAPLMHYIAWRILDGAVPYRDLFDMNFPGVYLIHVAVLGLLGPSSAAWRAVDLALTAGVAVLLFRSARPFGPRSAAISALLFSAYHLMGGPTQEGQRDLFLFFFLLAATLCAVRVLESQVAQPRYSLAAGVWLGVAITLKPQGALYALLLVGALSLGVRRLGRPWLREVTALCAGALVPVAAAGAWLFARGALASFLEIVFEFVLPIYPKIGRNSVWATLPATHYLFLALLTGISAACVARAWKRDALGPRVTLPCVGLGFGLFSYVAQAKGWSYHLIPWVGFACLLAPSQLDAVLVTGRRFEKLALLGGLAALSAATLVKGVRTSSDSSLEARQLQRVAGIVSLVRSCAAAGGTVQVLDTTQGGIHALFEARVRQPTRFIYDFPLFAETGSPYVQRLRAEFMREIVNSPPACVVMLRDAWPGGDYGRLDEFSELRDWLGAHYTLSVEQDDYRLYAQRRDQASHSGL
jgi:hypothetical protein